MEILPQVQMEARQIITGLEMAPESLLPAGVCSTREAFPNQVRGEPRLLTLS